MKPKNLASSVKYVSEKQLTIPGFESPFYKTIDPNNRWVKMSSLIPWDSVVEIYEKTLKRTTGRPPINGRVIMGAMIIKHYCDYSDEETILNIQENMAMQYFCGYSSYDPNPAFDSSLFVEIRERIGLAGINAMNDVITGFRKPKSTDNAEADTENNCTVNCETAEQSNTNKGRVLFDATACPQNIAYPTDLNILNDCREKSEELIDLLYVHSDFQKKPRTYRKEARKDYLKTAQKKNKTKSQIHKAIGQQLRYVKRNLQTINNLLDSTSPEIPLKKKELKYLWVINTCYGQQNQMYLTKSKSVSDRIVSIHQPHVRPIVRGKANAKIEFGSKINLSLVDGLSYIDELSWDAFNEGTHLLNYIEQYKSRHGFYPKEVLADKIYCNRENRKHLKELGIVLIAKPLGRPKAVPDQHVSPGERNPIEGKFGQAKTGYGMDSIHAKLKQTSETWVAMIVLVLNLVKLMGMIPLWLCTWIKSFSVKWPKVVLLQRMQYCNIPRIVNCF